MTPKPVEWAKDNWDGLRKTLNFDYEMGKAGFLLPPSAAKRLDDLDGDSFEVLTLLLKDRDALLARAELLDRAVEALKDASAVYQEAIPKSCGGCGTPYAACDMDCSTSFHMGKRFREFESILTSYASLPKMPEQGKSEEGKNG